MRYHKVIVIFLYFVQINGKSLNKSDNRVAKREIFDSTEELFPDWVPFKNKHGDELGEFVPVVQPKRRLIKRLAMPLSYAIKSFADADDYYEKGPENEGPDYFEMGELSDSSRSGSANIHPSDIETVLGALTKTSRKPDETNKEKPKPASEKQIKKSKTKTIEIDYTDDDDEIPGNSKGKTDDLSLKIKAKNNIETDKAAHDIEQKLILNALNKEEAMQTEERQRDIEIMDKGTVDKYSGQKGHKKDYDDYEEIVKDLGIDKYKYQPIRKITHDEHAPPRTSTILPEVTRSSFETETTSSPTVDIVPTGKISVFRNPSVYMVFDDDSSVESSSITASSLTTEPSSPPVTSSLEPRVPPKTKVPQSKKSQLKKAPKRNKKTTSAAPTTTTIDTYTPNSIHNPKNKKPSTERVRISLVPQDTELREGEPTLFFPKRRKQHHKDQKTKQHELDSTNATSYEDTAGDTSGSDTSIVQFEKVIPSSAKSKKYFEKLKPAVHKNGTSSAAKSFTYSGLRRSEKKVFPSFHNHPPISKALDTSESRESESKESDSRSQETDSKESGSRQSSENDSSAEKQVPLRVKFFNETRKVKVDTSPEESGTFSAVEPIMESSHRHGETEGKSLEAERGAVKEHHSEHHSSHGGNGKKEYSAQHKEAKTEEGHHDKGDHVGSYHDHGGHDEKHHDEKEHHGTHLHKEHGKKHAEYEESGRHSKGHSTKGSHDIHKKEEYEKNVEFFEEEGDSAEEQKEDRHKNVQRQHKGDKTEDNRYNRGNFGFAKGELKSFRKTGFGDVQRGHDRVKNDDSYGKHQFAKHGKKSHDDSRKWIFHHSHPAKTANFVVIDRRSDQLHHGPQYYG